MHLPRPGFRGVRYATRPLPILLIAALAASCASARGARTSLSILEARNHAVVTLQQYGYMISNDGGRGGDGTGELPTQMSVSGERQLQTGWQAERQATIVMRITLRRTGTGPESGTEVSVSPSVRYQSMARGGGGDAERRQVDALARRDAEMLEKALLSATSIGWN